MFVKGGLNREKIFNLKNNLFLQLIYAMFLLCKGIKHFTFSCLMQI